MYESRSMSKAVDKHAGVFCRIVAGDLYGTGGAFYKLHLKMFPLDPCKSEQLQRVISVADLIRIANILFGANCIAKVIVVLCFNDYNAKFSPNFGEGDHIGRGSIRPTLIKSVLVFK